MGLICGVLAGYAWHKGLCKDHHASHIPTHITYLFCTAAMSRCTHVVNTGMVCVANQGIDTNLGHLCDESACT